MTADEVMEKLKPLIDEGNPQAAIWQLRLLTADDPDAEAERLLAELNEMAPKVKAIVDAFASISEAVRSRILQAAWRDRS